jgi:outer membrane protein TolC
VFAPINTPMEEAVKTAFTNRPDLYSKEYQIRQQREQLRLARSRYLPNVSAYFTNTWANPSPSSFGSSANEWGRIWQAGVQGAWSIFDGFQREGDIMQQKARLRQAQIGLIDAEETAVTELTQAILSMENAAESVQSQQLNVTRATEGLRLADVGYQQGINTQVEVIDAQSALTTARVNYLQAIYQHVVAKLAVERAMGTIVTTPPSSTTESSKTGEGAAKTGDNQQIPDSNLSTPSAPAASPKEGNS